MKRNKGEGYIDICVGVVCFVALIIVSMNIFTFVTLRASLDTVASELAEKAAFEGRFSEDFYLEASDLLEGYDAEVRGEADEFFDEGDESVQLGEKMRVVIEADAYLSGIGPFKIPVHITVVKSCVSERYWKRGV